MNPFNKEQRPIDSQDDVRNRLRSLKKDYRGHLYDMLHEESEQYEKIINMYEEENKRLRYEKHKILKAKNAEVKKIKNESQAQISKALLECSNYLSRLTYSIQKSTELQKELGLQVVDEFKRYVDTCDEEEDKLFAEKLNILEEFTGEELKMVQEYVKQQEEMFEKQYRQQVEKLDLPEEMLKILAQSEKVKKLVHVVIEQDYKEIVSFGSQKEMPKILAQSEKVKKLVHFGKEQDYKEIVSLGSQEEMLTTKIEKIDFEIPDSAMDHQSMSFFGFGESGNAGEGADTSFNFNFDDNKNENNSEEFKFNF